jgi:hypothetical protein
MLELTLLILCIFGTGFFLGLSIGVKSATSALSGKDFDG